MNWHPIRTNPKDGGPFLAYAPSFVNVDYCPWGVIEAHWHDAVGFVGAIWNNSSEEWMALPVEPAYWMPQPKPPHHCVGPGCACEGS